MITSATTSAVERSPGNPKALVSVTRERPFVSRGRLEEALYRNWMIKEKLTTYTDEQFNQIISAISDYDWEKLSILEILNAVREKYLELQADVEAILGM